MNALSNTSSVEFGTYVSQACFDGYHYPGGASELVVHCTKSGNWSDTLPDCFGRSQQTVLGSCDVTCEMSRQIDALLCQRCIKYSISVNIAGVKISML